MDTFVEREEIQVLRVRADMKGSGPAGAMHDLESKLPTIRGRKFYGTFRPLPEGEEYFACVERIAGDDAFRMGVEVGSIPGGLYARRKILDWEQVIAAGKLTSIFEEMVRAYDIDSSRPDIEFYRSMKEMHLLVPALSKAPRSAPQH